MKEFIFQHISEFIIALVAWFFGWLTTRKQKRSDLISTKTDNSKKIMQLYQTALDDLEKRYRQRYEYLKQEYDQRLNELIADHESLKKEMELLSRQHEQEKRKYRELKNEFEIYKKSHS